MLTHHRQSSAVGAVRSVVLVPALLRTNRIGIIAPQERFEHIPVCFTRHMKPGRANPSLVCNAVPVVEQAPIELLTLDVIAIYRAISRFFGIALIQPILRIVNQRYGIPIGKGGRVQVRLEPTLVLQSQPMDKKSRRS